MTSVPTNRSQRPIKIFNRMFISIFLANVMLNFGQKMSNALLSVYADSLGAPASLVGILMSMFAVTALIFRFVSGPAINCFNRKLIVVCAMSLMGIAYLGFSFSHTVQQLMVFRLIQGVGNAFGNVCCLAMVSDVLPKEKFNTGMGYYTCAQVIAEAISPTLGLQLVKWLDYQKTYMLTACMMGIAIILATQIKLKPRAPKRFSLRLSEMVAKEALVPAAITFAVALGFTVINAFLFVYAEKRGVTDGIGLFFTVYALTLLLTRPLIGKLTDKHGFVKVGIPSIFMTVLSLAFIGMADRLWMFLLAAGINAFGYGALQPALQSLCIQSVPAWRRGSGSGTFYIGLDAATIAGPTIAGFVASKLGYTPVMWLVMTIPMLLGIVLIYLTRARISHIEKAFAESEAK